MTEYASDCWLEKRIEAENRRDIEEGRKRGKEIPHNHKWSVLKVISSNVSFLLDKVMVGWEKWQRKETDEMTEYASDCWLEKRIEAENRRDIEEGRKRGKEIPHNHKWSVLKVISSNVSFLLDKVMVGWEKWQRKETDEMTEYASDCWLEKRIEAENRRDIEEGRKRGKEIPHNHKWSVLKVISSNVSFLDEICLLCDIHKMTPLDVDMHIRICDRA